MTVWYPRCLQHIEHRKARCRIKRSEVFGRWGLALPSYAECVRSVCPRREQSVGARLRHARAIVHDALPKLLGARWYNACDARRALLESSQRWLRTVYLLERTAKSSPSTKLLARLRSLRFRRGWGWQTGYRGRLWWSLACGHHDLFGGQLALRIPQPFVDP